MERTALIVGGLGGIGKACARLLAEEGYRVLIVHRDDATSFLDELPGEGHQGYKCDAADIESVYAVMEQIAQDAPSLDVCLYTPADPIVRSTIETMSVEEFRKQFGASLFGAYEFFSLAFPRMKERGGLMLGVTTSFLEQGSNTSRMAGYLSAKAALRMLLRELAREGAPYKIRANALAPDFMDTKFSSDLPRRFFEWSAGQDPRGRLTTPEEVAVRLKFLLTEGIDVTGMSLAVGNDTITPL